MKPLSIRQDKEKKRIGTSQSKHSADSSTFFVLFMRKVNIHYGCFLVYLHSNTQHFLNKLSENYHLQVYLRKYNTPSKYLFKYCEIWGTLRRHKK